MRLNWKNAVRGSLAVVMCIAMLAGCRQSDNSSETAMNDISEEAYISGKDEADVAAGYVLARQRGILENDWKKFTVKIYSAVITLPCSANYLDALGLEMDTSFMAADTLVNRGNRESVYYKNQYGDAILVTFMNPDRIPKPMNECLVTGIAVTEYDLKGGDLTVTFPGGVEIGSSKSTAIIAYGAEYEKYVSDSVHMYTWHDENSYYKNCEIDYDAGTQKATCMIINY